MSKATSDLGPRSMENWKHEERPRSRKSDMVSNPKIYVETYRSSTFERGFTRGLGGVTPKGYRILGLSHRLLSGRL